VRKLSIVPAIKYAKHFYMLIPSVLTVAQTGYIFGRGIHKKKKLTKKNVFTLKYLTLNQGGMVIFRPGDFFKQLQVMLNK